MTGLDKMINQILEEAKTLACQKETDAKAQAEAILAQAQKEADEQKAGIEEKARKEAAALKSRLRSSNEQKRRTALLQTKQEIISETIEKTYREFCSKDAEEYFAVIREMVSKFALPEEGEILFSERDLVRMPKGMAEEIGGIAKGKGGMLTVSKETREIDGGFILVYGGVEENCSFRAIFDSRKDDLQDKVHRLLFL